MSQESNAHHDRMRDEDAVLEVAPPSVDRRSVLVGGGLGIATTVLPSAISAASVPTVEPSGAFSYPDEAQVLLHWVAFDPRPTGSPATYSSVAGSGANNVTGAHGRGGTGTGASDDPRVVGDGFTVDGSSVPNAVFWSLRSTTNLLTLAGDSASPHLEWTITNGDASTMTVSTLVIHRLRNASEGFQGPLNLAFYVSTSAGFASPVLRRTASIADNDTRHLVVPLVSGSSGGVALAASQTLTVRAFPYSTSTGRDVRFLRYGELSTGFSGGAPAIDTVDTTGIYDTTDEGDHICAFIGTLPT